jgi:c-di-GMP-related signal transduction protein
MDFERIFSRYFHERIETDENFRRTKEKSHIFYGIFLESKKNIKRRYFLCS